MKDKSKLICPNCGNTNPIYFGFKDGKFYCRLCVSMKAKEKLNKALTNKSKLILKYPLTTEQEEISTKVLENYKSKKDTLIYAVTGAGKTELVYKTIKYALDNNLTIGFAIPRRQVVIELATRIKNAFPNANVISVYGGNTSSLVGDIIVLTTHQLYRYQEFFDLLILDEIDAFPFVGNELLNNMFFKSIRGNYILMSATPNDKTIEFFKHEGREILYLNKRHHYQPIPVPKLIIANGYTKYMGVIKEMKRLINMNKKIFVFSPTIDSCEKLFLILNRFIKKGNVVHSKIKNAEEIINDFKNGNYVYLVSTAILERGVTVKGLQVIVVDADHSLYDKYSLIQIAGRAGRDHNEPRGEVIFFAKNETQSIIDSISEISNYNKSL